MIGRVNIWLTHHSSLLIGRTEKWLTVIPPIGHVIPPTHGLQSAATHTTLFGEIKQMAFGTPNIISKIMAVALVIQRWLTIRAIRQRRASVTWVFSFLLFMSAPSCHGMRCAWPGVGGELPSRLLANLAFYLTKLLPIVREWLLFTCLAVIIGAQWP